VEKKREKTCPQKVPEKGKVQTLSSEGGGKRVLEGGFQRRIRGGALLQKGDQRGSLLNKKSKGRSEIKRKGEEKKMAEEPIL